MIKSKLDARERALELAISYYHGIDGNRIIDAVKTARDFERYLIGNVELPEFVSNVEDMLEAVEILKKQMPEFSKTNDGQMEFLLPAPQDRKLMTKSESEYFKAMLVERNYIASDANFIIGDGNSYKKSFGGFELNLYITQRVGGYIVSPTIRIGEGMDAYSSSMPDYGLNIDRIERAALNYYMCYYETLNTDDD